MESLSSQQSRVHLKIQGRVQGVYFRAAAVNQARRLGLTGWVMNCYDGSVEAVAEGIRAKLEELVRWCHQGPPGAVVKQVHTQWEEASNEFQEFRIRR
jgi:acylphosphatase